MNQPKMINIQPELFLKTINEGLGLNTTEDWIEGWNDLEVINHLKPDLATYIIGKINDSCSIKYAPSIEEMQAEIEAKKKEAAIQMVVRNQSILSEYRAQFTVAYLSEKYKLSKLRIYQIIRCEIRLEKSRLESANNPIAPVICEVKVNPDSIEALGLNNRAYNALKGAGFNLIIDLVYTSKSDLLMVNNLGQGSLDDISNKLLLKGLKLKG